MTTNSFISECEIFGFILCSISTLSAAEPRPAISVSSADATLHLAVSGPAGLLLQPNRIYRLAEIGGAGASIPADAVPGLARDGAADPKSRLFIANLAPGLTAQGPRRFQLESVERGATSVPAAAFRFANVDDKSLGLWEGTRPVLVYNYGMRSKAGVPANRTRSTYLHPLYGLDGEVLTDDFPKDHYHHRGLFWTWPHITIGGQEYSTWDIRGMEQKFERWLGQQPGSACAILGVENGWYVGEKKLVQERVWIRIYPASSDEQTLDMDFTWIPLHQPITLAGAEGKSYGGLTLRFAPRTNTVITTPLGRDDKDLAITRLPWADLSAQFASVPKPSGAAIFIGPDHPDFPPTWLTRHYGVLCVGWPGVTPATFPPGEPIRCRYRVWIHRGAADSSALQRAYRNYTVLEKVRWE